MIINNNISALNTWHNIKKRRHIATKSLESLSSGLRIKQAADDAAGLAIREKMRAQIRGLSQAESNIQDGISLLQTADGAANEIHTLLQRVRELSIQSANGTLTDKDRQGLNKEVIEIKNEIDNIANNTEFNKIKVLDGSRSGEVITETIGEVIYTAPVIGVFKIDFNPTSVAALRISNSSTLTHAAFEFVDPPDKDAVRIEVDIGATLADSLTNFVNAFYAIKGGAGALSEQAALANMDVHIHDNLLIVTSTDEFTRTVDPARGVSMESYSTGSPATFVADPGITVIKGVRETVKIQVGGNANEIIDIGIPSVTKESLEIEDINISDDTGASQAITAIDKAILKVSDLRTVLGAYQNRLEHCLTNAINYEENLTAAESRISDADIAKEMMEKVKNDILMQSAQSLLAQANSRPNDVLGLLRGG